MKRSLLKKACLILIGLSVPCLTLTGNEAVPRWEIENYVIECRDNVFDIIKGDTVESASARAYRRINRELSGMVDRFPWTIGVSH